MAEQHHAYGGFPRRQGLYDASNERDACGIGFVADLKGRRSADIVRQGLEVLLNLSHRSAVGCDPGTGDGAGILLQIPDALYRPLCAAAGTLLPPAGAYGVGMLFLPFSAKLRHDCEAIVERAFAEQKLAIICWRDVPTDATQIGRVARRTAPVIRQVFVARGALQDDAFERALYLVRRRIESAVEALAPGGEALYMPSLSSRTVVYKGLLMPQQVAGFYTDLTDPRCQSALALVHSRFSTNTFPTWSRAHPYRYLCHNGEINTLKGNVNWMRVREGRLASELFGDQLSSLFPVVAPHGSDSANLDNALEFLIMGGRSLAHALLMLIPEAWSANARLDPARRAFFEYHASLMEPWDGPAAVAFTDGRQIGAMLDRNGLRPGRYVITDDDLVVLASEAGALPIDPARVRSKGRLQPGKMFLVDIEAGRIIRNGEIKAELAARAPYRQWIAQHEVRLESLPATATATGCESPLLQRQRAFGYTIEELRMVLTPMATAGEEAVGSMGTDTPLAVLSEQPQLLFKYFRQLFAQVTNPPIDPIREELVMSLAALVGPRGNLLEERPEHARKIYLPQPILSDAELAKMRALDGDFQAHTLRALFRAADGADALPQRVDELCDEAVRAIEAGATLLIISDRGLNAETAPVPSLLAVSAVHHALIRAGLRTHADLLSETGEARDVAHFALLLGYGAAAVNPYLAFETLHDLARHGAFASAMDGAAAESNYVKAIGKGLLKIFSKMGISTLQSYCGAQIFEAIGLDEALIARHFAGTASRLGGIGADSIAMETLLRHDAAFRDPVAAERLDFGGEYHYRIQGEKHGWAPRVIATLQHAVQHGSYQTFKVFSQLANEETESGLTLRGLLDFVAAEPIAVAEVEPASEIVRRFVTGAMSFGAISKEAHETLALAMNQIGGRSNSGEGGEEPERFGGARNSAIKQVASGRFGVTAEYLIHARELQIKMAQGAKPGEGGQLPGHKVDATIARTRYSTPGVTLISPPPHHDIYSIEDLAQLIADLKTLNPAADVSVKLVAEVGVGTVAAGVAKAYADLIIISGDAGGTGASPLSSIKHAGIPWELGLAETQQTLVLNDLRGRVRVQIDGQLKTGRDVMVAALLGADEFGFATAPLIAQGCIMMRKCHLNTCPVGIATQDPELRKKFKGEPEHVINYFFYVAEEVREHLARLGLRSLAEAIGRSDLLVPRIPAEHWKARSLKLDRMLHMPDTAPDVARRCVTRQSAPRVISNDVIDHQLIALAQPALERAEPVRARLPIRNLHRSVGAMLSGKIARRYGHAGLPDDTIVFHFSGSAGQSFGAFAAHGLTLSLEGEANDYVGKGLSGGRIVIVPPPSSHFAPEETIAVGNTVLYGATGGELMVHGTAGERFAVRNSGATSVIEGVGDHGCEYMTGGVVVILGKTGRNFAAGMSGGIAYVLDEDGHFRHRCNRSTVTLEPVSTDADQTRLFGLIERHFHATHSRRAESILDSWPANLSRFVLVMPTEYRRVLERDLITLQNASALLATPRQVAHG